MTKFASPLTFSAPENYKLTHSMQHITAAQCLLIRFPKNRKAAPLTRLEKEMARMEKR